MANKTLQFLRNATIYQTHEAAVTDLTAQLTAGVAAHKVGEPILARYTGEDNKEHIILGIVGATDYEIFDNAAESQALKEAIEALDAQVTSEDGTNVQVKVTEVDGVITAVNVTTDNTVNSTDIQNAIAALDATVSQTAGADGLALSVTEADGVITGISGSIAANTYDAYGAAADAVAALDATVNSTGGVNVAVQVAEEDGVITGVTVTDSSINATDLATAINALDANEVGGSGKVLTAISETDGIIAATAADFTDVVLGGYGKTSDTGAIAATDSLEVALSKLENTVATNAIVSDDGSITVAPSATAGTSVVANVDGTTIVKSTGGALKADLEVAKLTAAEVTALSDANVKEAYKLIYATDAGRTAIGDVVKIYKDSSLYQVYLGTTGDTITSPTDPTVVPGTGSEALCFIYQKNDGTYELVAVNVESFLQESEFEDGFDVNSTTHVVKVKIDANSEAVTTASGVTSPVLSVSASGVKVDNIQDAIDYAVATAIDALDSSDTAVADQFVTAVSEADGVITVTRAQPAAASVTVADAGGFLTATTVEAALQEICEFDCGTF